ncbi:MAG: Na+/H+ antiporter NhaA [Pseudomonadales bacterium]
MLKAIQDFLKLEAASGVLLVFAAILALIVANSPLNVFYEALITLPLEIRVGDFQIDKPLLLWINDGLMALFFLLVGLELKREFVDGELSDVRKVALPAAGAVGGMLVPAAIYVWINWGDAVALDGWAIPAATDIAFALAILTLLGNRVPIALRVFLVTIAIFDDVGAIVIIALFYTENLSLSALAVAGACLIPLFVLNRRGVLLKAPYLLIGVVMWTALLKSGVHATLAGVVLAFLIPLRAGPRSPAEELEHDLHSAVAYGVLPLFAFANAGLTLGNLTIDTILHPVPLGIILGLFVGKQIGVFGFCWLAVRAGLAHIPEGMSWVHVYGTALLCGVGFTMSLFIGSLAFEETGVDLLVDERLGILTGSLLSGLAGYLYLRLSLKENPQDEGNGRRQEAAAD